MPWNNEPLVVYHATTKRHLISLRTGVRIIQSKRRLDFGVGFYTTSWLNQAKIWARIKQRQDKVRRIQTGTEPIVLAYSVSRDELAQLDCLAFVRGHQSSTDYWAVVRHCRLSYNNTNRGTRKSYDMVYGPVAVDWEIPGRERALEDYDQISFHTEKAVNLLLEPELIEVQ